MPQAYSDDLCWRVIWKKFDGYTIKQTSKNLLVGETFVKKIRSRFAHFATVHSPYFRPRGRAEILRHDDIEFLRELMRQRTNWYLYEIQTELENRIHRSISINTIWSYLKKLGYSHKQISKQAEERCTVARATFTFEVSYFSVSQLVFCDESAYDKRVLSRRFGWALRGERACMTSPFIRGKRYTIEAAITIFGFLSYAIQEGPMTEEDFFGFIVDELIPQMNPYPLPLSVLIMDNAIIHKSERLKQVCFDAGIKLIYLPPYSPDFNPIEQAFFYVKNWLRAEQRWVETVNPLDALEIAIKSVRADMVQACFHNSGYG